MEDSTVPPGGNPGDSGLLTGEGTGGIITAPMGGVAVFTPPAKTQVADDVEYLPDGKRKLLISGDIIIRRASGEPIFLLRIFSNLFHGKPWANPVSNQFQAFFYRLIAGQRDAEDAVRGPPHIDLDEEINNLSTMVIE